MNLTQDSVLYCPKCLSPAVDASGLVGGTATCRLCNWTGQQQECPTQVINHEFASSEEVLRTFVRDVQRLVAEFGALPLGRLLRKWGFLIDGPDGRPDQDVLVRYVKAVGRGVAEALIKERDAIERDAHSPQQGVSPGPQLNCIKVVGRG